MLGPRSRESRTGLMVPRVSHSVARGSEVVSGLPCGPPVGVRGAWDLGTRWVQVTRRALSRGWGMGPCESSCSRPRPPPSEPGGGPAQDQTGQVARRNQECLGTFRFQREIKKGFFSVCCCSVTKSCLTLRPRGLQPTRLPCPSLSPRVCANSRPLSQWCCLTISSSAALFFCLQSLPASGSFPVSRLFF